MNSIKMLAAAGALLAVLAPSAANAQSKAVTLRLGAFIPTDGDIKDAVGKSWLSFGGDFVIKGTTAGGLVSAATLNSVEPLVYADFASKSKNVDGGKNEASTLGVGVGARYFPPTQSITSVRPYIAGGVGAYFLHGKSTTTTDTVPPPPTGDLVPAALVTTTESKNKTNFGFKINGGVEFAQNYVVDVAYWNAGKIQDVRIDGYTVSLGMRF